MHKIRKSLRAEGEVQGVVLMGKNTMVCCGYGKLSLHMGSSELYGQYADCSRFRYEEPSKGSSAISRNTSAYFPTLKVLPR